MDYNMGEKKERRENAYICGNYTCMVHVIRPGDTLYRLSREYGVKVSALMMANPFVDIYNLRIGDELCIPRLRRMQEKNGNVNDMGTEMPEMEEEKAADAKMNEEWRQPVSGVQQERTSSEAQQREDAVNERVVDMEMNMMQEKKRFLHADCQECDGIKYQKSDDTY